MIEPGPVHTEFETKMMEDVAKMEYPGVDADTVRYFKDVYLPSSIDIFEAMGQTPEDIAKVRGQFSNSHFTEPPQEYLFCFSDHLLIHTLNQPIK